MESKYEQLKDQILKFTKTIEEEKFTSEKLKCKNSEDIKSLESKIKNMISEERENSKIYIEESIKRVETKVANIEKIAQDENRIINENISIISDNLEVIIISYFIKFDIKNILLFFK